MIINNEQFIDGHVRAGSAHDVNNSMVLFGSLAFKVRIISKKHDSHFMAAKDTSQIYPIKNLNKDGMINVMRRFSKRYKQPGNTNLQPL